MGECEKCGFKHPAESYELLDYCAHCGKNLCDECMKKGCCGHVPAESGQEADDAAEEQEADGPAETD